MARTTIRVLRNRSQLPIYQEVRSVHQEFAAALSREWHLALSLFLPSILVCQAESSSLVQVADVK